MGWVIAAIAIVALNFLFFLCIAASSSSRDAFDREEDDREQMDAIREYYRRKAEKRQRKLEKRKRRMR